MDQGDESICDLEQVDIHDVKRWGVIDEWYWYLFQNPGEYETVVIDTASMLQHLAIVDYLDDDEVDLANAGDWGTMTQSDWGKISQMMKQQILRWRDLPCNVVFLAQERLFNLDEDDLDDDQKMSPEVGPALSPAVAKALNAAVHMIGHTFIREHTFKKRTKKKGSKKTTTKEVTEVQYCLRIGPDPLYITKLRKPKSVQVPGVLVNPSYSDIMKIVKDNG